MRTFKSRYPIAIDLSDPTSAVALQLASGSATPTIHASALLDRSQSEDDTLSEDDGVALVRDVLRNKQFKGNSIAMLPPPGSVLSYPLRVTPARTEALEAAIVREAREVIPMPFEEAVLDYISVRPDPIDPKRSVQVLLVVIRKSVVEQLLQIVQKGGGVLESIEPDVSALLRAHSMTAALSGQIALLCHIGRSQTVVLAASREGVVAARMVPWSTDRLRRKLTDNLELQNAERDVDFLLRRFGMLDADAIDKDDEREAIGIAQTATTVAQLLTPLVEDFAHALHSLVGYVRSASPDHTLGHVYLYGEVAQVAGLDTILSRELNLPCETMDPVHGLGALNLPISPTPLLNARFALAAGLAVRRVKWL